MSALKFTVCSFIVVVFFLTVSTITHAQTLDGISDVTINTSPNYPEPFEKVVATLDAYSYNTNGATIQWFIDGTEEVISKNARKITFGVGGFNESTNLGVLITLANGQTLSASKIISPARVDIVIEANTETPLFYKGRALPSSGSTVRAIALTTTNENLNTLTYTWKLGNKVLFGGSQIGRNVAVFNSPLGGSGLLSVTVAEKSGAIITKKVVTIPNFEPEIYFYETNPLRGISRNAIQSPHVLVGDEINIRAGTYYMDKNLSKTTMLTEWKINGSRIDNPSTDPQEITLRGGGGTGSFRVGFQLRNLDNLLQGVKDDFVIAF